MYGQTLMGIQLSPKPKPSPLLLLPRHRNFSLRCRCASPSSSSQEQQQHDRERELKTTKKSALSKQSSWEAKDSQGDDYLLRLGAEADNMNISVGARHGVIDDLFVGTFLGKDSDIVFDYRQKATRSFQYLQGDYYIAPLFMVYLSPFFFNIFIYLSILHILVSFLNFPTLP